jgi:septal ring factor EnvC (AmiA/AmiB activator)
MEPGELEYRKVFEEVSIRNIKTISDFTQETRDLIRDYEKRTAKFEEILKQHENEISQLRNQLAAIQGQFYSGGTS